MTLQQKKLLLRKGVGISAALDLKFTLSGRRQRDLAEPIPRGKSWGFLVVLLFWCFVFFFSTMHFEPLIKGDFIFPSAAAEGREGHGRAITAGRGGTSLPGELDSGFSHWDFGFPRRQAARRQAASLQQAATAIYSRRGGLDATLPGAPRVGGFVPHNRSGLRTPPGHAG